MSKTYINIAGQTLDPAGLTLPATRDHRDAWIVDPTDPTTIIVDPVKARQLRIPEAVTKVGLKRACEERADWNGSGMNLWQIAKTALAALGESEQDDWNLATSISRTNTTFLNFATSPEIGASLDQIDDIFIRAAEIDAERI